MQPMFSIPRLTEEFLDECVRLTGGKRFTELVTPGLGMENPDYVLEQVLAEAKIFEEEGLEKASRQSRIAALLAASDLVLIEGDFYEQSSTAMRHELDDLFLEPIQRAVKKANKQVLAGKNLHQFSDFQTALIAVNSGYSSLSSEMFEALVMRACQREKVAFDFIVCISLHYHQGSYDAYVFLKTETFTKTASEWPGALALTSAAKECFGDAMTKMMRNQLKPNARDHLPPVQDIRFENDGVKYVREAPFVPDSRFKDK